MTVEAAQLVLMALAVYVGCGVVFLVPFLWRGIGRIDPLAAKGTTGFRVLVAPGLMALWPWFAIRLIAGRRV
jgi:hypothetical protein